MKRGRKHRKTKQSTALEMKQERELSPPPSPPACGCWSNCFPKMPLFGNKGRKQERQREKEQLQELQTERRKTELTLTKTTQKTKKERQRKIQKEEALGVQESSSVMVELIAFDSAASKLIGSTTIKLQEVLYKSSVTQHIDLRLGRTKVCKLDADLMFTYGSFGYGYSHQQCDDPLQTILGQHHVLSDGTRHTERQRVQDICWCNGLHGEERQVVTAS